MKRGINREAVQLFVCKCTTAVLVMILTFLDVMGVFLITFNVAVPEVEAAEVVIDSSVHTDPNSFNVGGAQTVFVSDQTGYRFYRDASGECVYSKTTNGGTSWGGTTIVDDRGTRTDCDKITVWYDQWTPGDTDGTYIHIATQDRNPDETWYNRLDTSDDSLLTGSTAISTASNSGQVPTLSNAANTVALTKGTDGTLYMAISDGNDSYVVDCSADCGNTASWDETGTSTLTLDTSGDHNILVPLNDANGDIMLIQRDVSANDIETRIWGNASSSWTPSWDVVDASAAENSTYDVSMAAMVSSTTGEVYLAYIAGHNNYTAADHDLKTATWANGTWTNNADMITNDTRGLVTVSLGIDKGSDDIYVGYSARTDITVATSSNVYWRRSTDGMASWGNEQGPVDSNDYDIRGVDINNYSPQRMYISWFEDVNDELRGDTIADIAPGVTVGTTSAQEVSITASTSNFYIGGSFSILDNNSSRNVTAITITESGTVDGANGIANIDLFYESDQTAPYDCASESYGGGESKFGATDENGFSGANGVASFSGTSVEVSTTSAMCVYVVLDVLKAAADGSTLNIEIDDPPNDITVTNSGEVFPDASVDLTGSTTIQDYIVTQEHFHWRNDDGNENDPGGATSATAGSEDVSLNALQQDVPRRLRFGLSNEGSTTTPQQQYRIEYSTTTGNCAIAEGWTDVGATDDDWNMFDSSNLTEGANTSNIAEGIGGVSDENVTYLTTNGGVRDTTSQTGLLILNESNYVDLEFSIVASTTAQEGNTYCFRVTDAGVPLDAYDEYPQVTISADVTVSATGTQIATADIPTDNVLLGGTFVIAENSGSRNVTDITITETGSIDASTDVGDVRIYYELDSSNPYNCESESFDGTENQFGATSTDGFSSENGTTTFTDTVGITTTDTLCIYTMLDITSSPVNGETIDIQLANASTDVVVSGGGSVAPSAPVDITGSTTLAGGVVTQVHYHWRNDNGNEDDPGGATSATGGNEDTELSGVSRGVPYRLRFGLSNEGSTTSVEQRFLLEFAPRISTCGAVTESSWTNIDESDDDWNLYDSTFFLDGDDTTDIAEGIGGVTDENTVYLTTNSMMKDTSPLTPSTTLENTGYVDVEYSIVSTTNTAYDTTYCFRVSASGTPLLGYDTYAEITTAPKRDFFVQRGSEFVYGTSTTLVAGTDYIAPAATTSAFIRITNAHHTGAGRETQGNQSADDLTAFILDPENILTSVTIARPAAAVNSTRVSWEIVEYIGDPGTDNEIIVRGQGTTSFPIGVPQATGTPTDAVTDDSDVVVFITGVQNTSTNRNNYPSGQATAIWGSTTTEPVFARIASSSVVHVSYAVVEFTGINWNIQRVEHTYDDSGDTEIESIAPVNSLDRAFLHTQKRMGLMIGMDEFGHNVWLSSMGAVSFLLQSGAATTSEHTSVAWVIENTQTSTGAMDVIRFSGSLTGGPEPATTSIEIGETLQATNNASVFLNARQSQTGTNYPRPMAGVFIASTTHFEIFRGDTGGTLTYQTEFVTWPVADLAYRQNYYRFYVDNGVLDPTDPWPAGVSNLGENTSITVNDEPLAEGERARIRMTLRIANVNMPAGIESFKLQYGERDSTCSAIEAGGWFDLGSATSGVIWRGYVTGIGDGTPLATSTPAPGTLNISVADVAGTYEDQNNSAANPFAVSIGEDVEYDWVIEHNGAKGKTNYCFRMIKSDGTALSDYSAYPELLTAGYSPVTRGWRWYDDETNETPTSPLADEDTAPIDVAHQNDIKLRVAVDELKNVDGTDVKFRLQFSESSDFSDATDLVATSSCAANSLWCYADGVDTDNATITTALLSDSDACVAEVGDGCGTHNESASVATGYTHTGSTTAEFEFTLRNSGARVNTVYYFRLYDVASDQPVSIATGETYPSAVTEGAALQMGLSGIPAATVTEGVTTDIETSINAIQYGSLPEGTQVNAAHRVAVTTNGTEGYQVFVSFSHDLMSSNGSTIDPVTGTNAAPTAWGTGCSVSAAGCFGYHAGDDTLSGGSTRFSAVDTYAGATTTLGEIMYSSLPENNEQSDIIYRVSVEQDQPAGQYESTIRYITVPIF